jgi:DNA polymerase-1
MLAPAIDARGLRQALRRSIELPLAGVLARMERTGVRIDRESSCSASPP